MSKFLNIFISITFLMSFVGIQINKHYVGGQLYSFAVYHEAETCCDDMASCPMAKMASRHCKSQTKDNCSCENETELLKIDDVFTYQKFSVPTAGFVSLFRIANFQNAKISSSKPLNLLVFCPLTPPSDRDFQAQMGTFRC